MSRKTIDIYVPVCVTLMEQDDGSYKPISAHVDNDGYPSDFNDVWSCDDQEWIEDTDDFDDERIAVDQYVGELLNRGGLG